MALKWFKSFPASALCFAFALIAVFALNQYWFEPEDLPPIPPHSVQRNTVLGKEVVVEEILYPDNQTFAQKRCKEERASFRRSVEDLRDINIEISIHPIFPLQEERYWGERVYYSAKDTYRFMTADFVCINDTGETETWFY